MRATPVDRNRNVRCIPLHSLGSLPHPRVLPEIHITYPWLHPKGHDIVQQPNH